VVGVLVTVVDFMLFYVLNINFYKWFVDGLFVFIMIVWGLDNCICVVCLVGYDVGVWMENWILGVDVNFYFVLVVMLVGGLYGIENQLPLEFELVGNVYYFDWLKVLYTMYVVCEVFVMLKVGWVVLGDEVVDYYVNMVDVELVVYDVIVIDWELH